MPPEVSMDKDFPMNLGINILPYASGETEAVSEEDIDSLIGAFLRHNQEDYPNLKRGDVEARWLLNDEGDRELYIGVISYSDKEAEEEEKGFARLDDAVVDAIANGFIKPGSVEYYTIPSKGGVRWAYREPTKAEPTKDSWHHATTESGRVVLYNRFTGVTQDLDTGKPLDPPDPLVPGELTSVSIPKTDSMLVRTEEGGYYIVPKTPDPSGYALGDIEGRNVAAEAAGFSLEKGADNEANFFIKDDRWHFDKKVKESGSETREEAIQAALDAGLSPNEIELKLIDERWYFSKKPAPTPSPASEGYRTVQERLEAIDESGLTEAEVDLYQDNEGYLQFREKRQVEDEPEPEATMQIIDGQRFLRQPDGTVTPWADEPDPTIQELIENRLVAGDATGALALADFRDRPTSIEAMNAALAYAQSPGDVVAISNIARGRTLVQPPPTGQVQRIAEQPEFLQNLYQRLFSGQGTSGELVDTLKRIAKEREEDAERISTLETASNEQLFNKAVKEAVDNIAKESKEDNVEEPVVEEEEEPDEEIGGPTPYALRALGFSDPEIEHATGIKMPDWQLLPESSSKGNDQSETGGDRVSLQRSVGMGGRVPLVGSDLDPTHLARRRPVGIGGSVPLVGLEMDSTHPGLRKNKPTSTINEMAGGGIVNDRAIVGERGPELIIAPSGAQVIPLGKTEREAKQLLARLKARGIKGLANGGSILRTKSGKSVSTSARTIEDFKGTIKRIGLTKQEQTELLTDFHRQTSAARRIAPSPTQQDTQAQENARQEVNAALATMTPQEIKPMGRQLSGAELKMFADAGMVAPSGFRTPHPEEPEVIPEPVPEPPSTLPVLPVGVNMLLRGSALDRTRRRLSTAAGLPVLSAQTRQRTSPDEMDVFNRLAGEAGISAAEFAREQRSALPGRNLSRRQSRFAAAFSR